MKKNKALIRISLLLMFLISGGGCGTVTTLSNTNEPSIIVFAGWKKPWNVKFQFISPAASFYLNFSFIGETLIL